MRPSSKAVHPFQFDLLSGGEFERLVFAFLLRRWSWISLDWSGQSGDDGGRDIIGVREDEYGRTECVVVACANWRRLTTEKACGDLDKIVASGTMPNVVYVLAGGKVSSDLKLKVSDHARSLKIYRAETWSGPEFEEHLRAYAETVAARFFNGEELPDDPAALRAFVEAVPTSEEEGRLVARVFDRPAFTTRFQEESSLPAFSQALANTVEALNTGLWRTRDGALIGRVPSKHDFKNPVIRAALTQAANGVVSLRRRFEELKVDKQIRRCNCDDKDCPVVFSERHAADEMNQLRHEILRELQSAIPEVVVRWP